MPAHDERVVLEVERAVREVKQIVRWSRRLLRSKAAVSIAKTIWKCFRLIQAVGASRGENRARSGRERIRGRGDCEACAA